MLRLVVGHNGKHPIYLVTSVLSSRRLTDRQVIESTGDVGAWNCSFGISNKRISVASCAARAPRTLEWSWNGR